ncbi:hypothetical protein EDB89DRAFT_1913355 [Lactarius sanguifluus]|nr:hypothetical protein EDB89DRAFT_1913355 [Lactarius sanguifluus]
MAYDPTPSPTRDIPDLTNKITIVGAGHSESFTCPAYTVLGFPTDLGIHSGGSLTVKKLYPRAAVFLAFQSTHTAIEGGEVRVEPVQSRLQFLRLDLTSLLATKAVTEEFHSAKRGCPECVM